MTACAVDIEIDVIAKNEKYLPKYATDFAAGADLFACIDEALSLEPGASMLVPTGLKMAIPQGFEMQIRPRSGLAYKNQVTVLNTPGTIDADYRGELGVILINHGKDAFLVEAGMRIAQLIVAPVVRASFVKVEKLSETCRGDGGFGHTGML